MSDFSSCVFNRRGKCNVFWDKKGDLSRGLVPLSTIDGSVNQHAMDLGIDLSSFNERSLIMNRMGVSDICEDNDMICPYHRYAFGIFWRPSSVCQAPYHVDKKPKASRCLPPELYKKLLDQEIFNGNNSFQFPVGEGVCVRCSMKIKAIFTLSESSSIDRYELPPRVSKIEAMKQLQEVSMSDDDLHSDSGSTHSSNIMMIQAMPLDEINQLLSAVLKNIQPFTYQIRQSIETISSITVRELKRDYGNKMEKFSSFICECMAPGQGEQLRQLFQGVEETNEDMDPTLQSIVEAYHLTSNAKWKLFLLSLVPAGYSSKELQTMFNCTRYSIDKSHIIQNQNLRFNIMEKKIIRRERLDKNRIEFFFDFLFTSGLIQDVAYGTTMMEFDNKEKIVVPHVIQNMMKTHIVQLYEQHCIKIDHSQAISRSTAFRLLNTCKMRQKKTLCGLDSFAVDGNDGFDTLQSLVKSFRLKLDDEKNLLQLIKLSRNYLKYHYKQNVIEDDSACATHCRLFALSSSSDKSFMINCGHSSHSMSCVECNALFGLLDRIDELANSIPSSEFKEECLFDFSFAKTSIFSWMFHIVRGIQQENSKQYVLSQLDQNSALLLSDWAMKILPQAHREKMEQWFGKKGMSLHVDVLFYKDANNNLKKKTYFTTIDRCLQDMGSVLCVFECVLNQIKIDFPNIHSLYTRSDNAGCYAGAAVILCRPLICSRLGISLNRTDFSEPQRGKDQADRDIAVAKSCLKAYVNRGNNLINAGSIKDALDQSFGNLSGSQTCVITIDESKCILPKVKIPDITKIHSIAFDNNLATLWQYFNIGNGKSKVVSQLELDLSYLIQQPFSDVQHTRREFTSTSRSSTAVFFCSENGCSGSFDNEDDLIEHEQSANHVYFDDRSLSSNDHARHIFIEHLRGERLVDQTLNQTAIESLRYAQQDTPDTLFKPTNSQNLFLCRGYAIRRRSPLTKILEKHHVFFKSLFQQGEESGKKCSVRKAFDVMRSMRNPDGSKLFAPNQYLNQQQIRSLFGRYSKQSNFAQSGKAAIVDHLHRMDSVDSDSAASDEEAAEDYLRQQQDQEQQQELDEEFQNALKLFPSFDDSDDRDMMEHD